MAETGVPRVDFDESAILQEAREKTGLDDFGDDDFREPLRVLLRSLDTEADLNPMGRATQRARIVGSLATRLSAQDYVSRHPEILDQKIEAPFFVVGLARTGTTMLQRLLAADPGLYSVLWWECRSPAPVPGSRWREDDPRIPDAHAEVKLILETTPELAAIHPWDPEGPDEEILLIEHAFLSHVPESGANLSSYRSWLTDQDLAPGYRYLKRMLQFLQWQKQQSGRPAERWVLKSPFHLGYLDVLFHIFPDAKVIQTHRDPLETLPSVASMYRALWKLGTDAVDDREVGRQCLERWAWALTRCLRSRDAMPEDRFLDVWYRDVLRDPLSQVQSIYEFVGREFSREAEASMRQWARDNPRDKRAAHEYTLEEFGYTPEAICEAFAEYRARFIESRAEA